MDDFTPPRGNNSSATFRESDAEFLQTEAREWLEAVLEEKLDPRTSLQDLLADGTVLYRVSQIVKENLSKVQKGQAEHSSPATGIPSPDVHRRTSLKYQPYSYVEAFLKVCKDVGLLDLDLFNPSDAVDKKDIRHVCVCLRRLSKKARTLNIRLPDFDNVKHTLMRSPSHKHSMPTEAVHNLRDSLQQPSNKPVSRFNMNEELSKETSSSIADLQKGDSDPNPESSESGVRSEELQAILQEPDGIVESGEPSTTSVSAERDLRPVSETATTEKPQVSGLELNSTLEQHGAKEKGKPKAKVKGRYPWLPYAAGVVIFVGAIAVLVVARERRQSSPVVYEVQPGDTLGEIARRTGRTSWQEIIRNSPDVPNPHLIHPLSDLSCRK